MGRVFASVLLLVVGCKASVGGGMNGGGGDDTPEIDAPEGGEIDAAIDGPEEPPLGAWSTPQLLPGGNAAMVDDDDPAISPNSLELIIATVGANGKRLYRLTRPTKQAPWSAPMLSAVNGTTGDDQTPRYSANGLELYFSSTRAGGPGKLDIYKATRTDLNADFGNVTQVTYANLADNDRWYQPYGPNDGRYLLISLRNGDDDEDIYDGKVGDAPTIVTPISSPKIERGLSISADELVLYFGSNAGTAFALYTSTRATTNDAWPAPVPFTEFAGVTGPQEDPCISADGRTFLFTASPTGTKDIYYSTR